MQRYECRIGRIESNMTTHWILSRMSWVATKLYNTALWNARSQWEKTKKIPTGFELHKYVLASVYREQIHTHTAQDQADRVWRAFRSWFKLRKIDKTARPPGFRPKQLLSVFTLKESAFKPMPEGFRISLGGQLKKDLNYPYQFLNLKVAWNTPLPSEYKFKQLEIVPRDGYFEVHAKILLPEPVWRTEGTVKAIDLGERNPVAIVGEDGKSELFKGGSILSIMRYWNKEKGRVQGEVMSRSKNKRRWSEALARMNIHGNRQKKQAIHALTKQISDSCNKGKVKEVVVGNLTGIKKECDGKGKNWKDKSSQNWQQFPISMLVSQLRYKLARSGIRLVEIDESGTSKGRCSVCGNTDRASIRRVHRGLFRCDRCRTTLNADINGARNILDRYLHREGQPSTGSSGCLAHPSVWRWDNHQYRVVA